MEEKTGASLIALARCGNKQAFSELIERYQAMAQIITLRLVGNIDIAREMAQEAMLQAYLSLDHLRDDARFKGWFYGIVLNVCRSYLREQKKAPALPGSDAGRDESWRELLFQHAARPARSIGEAGTASTDAGSGESPLAEKHGKRVRFSGYVKSESVEPWAGLWMRVEGPNGRF
jgi:DNA-directed RNA polymerase specialized sigma24 family protein